MRKILLLLFVSATTLIVTGQGIDSAKKLIYNERYRSAQDLLKNILKSDRGNAEGWYLLSLDCILVGDVHPVEDQLVNIPQEVKDQPIYQVAYGQLLLYEDKIDSASYYFNQAIDKTKGKDPAILMAIAKAQLITKPGNAQYALDLLDKAEKKEKKSAELNRLRGDAYRKLTDGSEAYKAYQAAINDDDKDAAAYYKVGKIFTAQKNPEMYLEYFTKAIRADSNYAPAYFELYYHYYYTIDVAKALGYFEAYQRKSDYDKHNDYLYADLLFLNKMYQPAIAATQKLLNEPAGDTIPRLYKLAAYSYLGLNDTIEALSNMRNYFAKEADSNKVAKDYETMTTLYESSAGNPDSAIAFNIKIIERIKDSNTIYQLYKKLANTYKARKDYANEALWLGKYYIGNPKATNIDLFNWGISNYEAGKYEDADTVFGRYIQKYPEQGFGYYWRARSNSLRDSAIEKGYAVSWYNQLIPMIEKDTSNKTHKKWLIEAYGYLAAYETNELKEYDKALELLHKVLDLDPGNKDAEQYVAILEKQLSAKKDVGSSKKPSSSSE